MRHAGRTVFVTGAASGIGKAVARRFITEGANVAIIDNDSHALMVTAGELGEKAYPVPCDVADEAEMRHATAIVGARWGNIGAAVLNAGIEGATAEIRDADLSDFDRVMRVNVRGVFIGMKLLLPQLQEAGGGTLTAIASTAGLRGSAGLAPYCASKHAVIGLVKSAAIEAAGSGIRVNAICPGPVETRMMRSIEAGRAPHDPRSVHAALTARIPLRRYGTADEIAAIAAFLASDDAAYVTGTACPVDGGIMAGA